MKNDDRNASSAVIDRAPIVGGAIEAERLVLEALPHDAAILWLASLRARPETLEFIVSCDPAAPATWRVLVDAGLVEPREIEPARKLPSIDAYFCARHRAEVFFDTRVPHDAALLHALISGEEAALVDELAILDPAFGATYSALYELGRVTEPKYDPMCYYAPNYTWTFDPQNLYRVAVETEGR